MHREVGGDWNGGGGGGWYPFTDWLPIVGFVDQVLKSFSDRNNALELPVNGFSISLPCVLVESREL